MKRIKINKRTAKHFWKNIQKKKYMVCWMYYNFKIGENNHLMLDIAQTRYPEVGDSFNIGCRGTGYIDSFLMEDHDPIKVIMMYVHSFCVFKNQEANQ